MAISDTITSIEDNLRADYEGLENIYGEITGINKNILNIRTILDTIYNDMPKVTGEGTEVTLSPTRKGRLALIPKGNSEQESRDDKNKIAIPDISNGTTSNGLTYTIENGLITINGTTTTSKVVIFCELINPIQFSNGTNYVMSAVLDGTLEGGNISLGVYNATTDDTSVFGRQQNQFPITSNTIEGTANYLGGYIAYGRTFTNYKIKLQIELGTTPTTWQQGGATPSPSIPSPIKSVTGNNNVVVNSANLLSQSNLEWGNISTTTGENGGGSGSFIRTKTFIKVSGGSKYSGNYTKSTGLEQYILYKYDSNKNYLGYDIYDSVDNFTKTLENNVNYIRLRLLSVGNTETEILNNISDVIFNNGDVIPYVPYQNQTLPLNLGTKKVMLGDTMQDNGIHHVRKQAILGNVTTVSTGTIFGVPVKYVVYRFPNEMIYQNTREYTFFCNKVSRANEVANVYSGYTTSSNFVVIVDDNDTVETVNEKLADAILEFDLATEETEAYTETQQAQYDDIQKMKSYEGTTIITSTFDENNSQMIISASGLKGE